MKYTDFSSISYQNLYVIMIGQVVSSKLMPIHHLMFSFVNPRVNVTYQYCYHIWYKDKCYECLTPLSMVF
jgi:hypothetical protein